MLRFTDLLKSKDAYHDHYLAYNRRCFDLADHDHDSRRSVAESISGSVLDDSKFKRIHNEANKRRQQHFDMGLFHKKLKDNNLWQWGTTESAERDEPHQREDIHALMDKISGKKLTIDEIDALKNHYVRGHVLDNGDWEHPSGDVTFNLSKRNADSRIKNAKYQPVTAAVNVVNQDVKEPEDMDSSWERLPHGHRQRHEDGYHYHYESGKHAQDSHHHHDNQAKLLKRRMGRALWDQSPKRDHSEIKHMAEEYMRHRDISRHALAHYNDHTHTEGPAYSMHKATISTFTDLVVNAKLHGINNDLSFLNVALRVFNKGVGTAPEERKPPGGEEEGWQRLKRTRHNGWYKELANGGRKYWYPDISDAKNAHSHHIQESERARERALKTTDPAHRERHLDAARQHTEIASGAADMSEDHGSTRSGIVLAAVSSWVGKRIRLSEIEKIRYSVLERGGDIAALAIKFGSSVFTVTPTIARDANVSLDGLYKYLRVHGASMVKHMTTDDAD